MIIQCTNCNKNFEVKSSLIPEIGRNLQCGLCDFTWFYKPISNNATLETNDTNNNEISKNIDVFNDNQTELDQTKKVNDKTLLDKQEFTDNIEVEKRSKVKKSINFSLIRLLFFILVGIISFVALIVVLDTFNN